jgi:hypothetical protein
MTTQTTHDPTNRQPATAVKRKQQRARLRQERGPGSGGSAAGARAREHASAIGARAREDGNVIGTGARDRAAETATPTGPATPTANRRALIHFREGHLITSLNPQTQDSYDH